MTFLAASLCAFAALAAIPVIIHLLNRRRFRIVVWAAMEFLLTTLEKNSRRLQLRDIVLMLLRAGTIVFLALALARPTLAPGRFSLLGGKGATAAVVVLDNSMSMGYEVANQSRFALARTRAKDIVDLLPDGSSVALLLLSDLPVDDIPQPSHDIAFVSSEIAKAPLSDGGTDVVASLSRAISILASSSAVDREIYLVTDMQKNAWAAPASPTWRRLEDELANTRPQVRLFITDVGDHGTDNLDIDGLSAEDTLVTTGADATFVATLDNHGPAPAHDVTVELKVGDDKGGDMHTVASQTVDSVDGTREVRLQYRFKTGGVHRIEAVAGIDHLSADNHRYLAIDVIDRIKVLIIDGAPAQRGVPFSGESDFLKVALSPRDLDSDDPSLGHSLIQADITTVDGLGERSLRDYQAVIMTNVGELPPGLVDGLRTFVETDGKGLIVFLGDNVSAKAYNAALYDQVHLLPGRLGDVPAQAPTGSRGFGFSTQNLTSPVVAFFASKETAPYLAQPRFRTAFPIIIDPADLAASSPTTTPGPAAPATHVAPHGWVDVVASFDNGSPAIAERRAGRGRVLLFASSASRRWTDFPLTPAYLMVTRRAVEHVALARRPVQTLRVHDQLIDMLPAKESGATLVLHDPRGQARKLIAVLTPNGDFAEVQDAHTDFAGFYRLLDPAGGGDSTYIAANPPPAESRLEALDQAGLKNRYPKLAFEWIDGHGDISRSLAQKRVGREIWPFVLLLSCLCLLTESVLALRWAPRGD